MGIDQHIPQTLDAEPLNESHAAHVRGEVVDLRGAVDSVPAVRLEAQVEAETLGLRQALKPLRQRLLVDGANAAKSALVEVAHEGSADEAPRPCDHDHVVCCSIGAGKSSPTFDLGMIGNIITMLEQLFVRLRVEYRFKDAVVVAHSMGGLVTRASLLKDYERK